MLLRVSLITRFPPWRAVLESALRRHTLRRVGKIHPATAEGKIQSPSGRELRTRHSALASLCLRKIFLDSLRRLIL
jgi:hypothetical protein